MTPLRYILALATLISLHAPAIAATSPCVSPTNTWPVLDISPTPSMSYQGLAASITVTINVTTPSNARSTCQASLQLDPGSSGDRLYGPAGASLAYQASSLFPWDPGWNRVQIAIPPNATKTYSFTFSLPAGQAPPVGAYSRSFELRLYDTLLGGMIRSNQFTISATVTTTCDLPPPDLAALDFSAAVHAGRIPTQVQQQVTFRNAGCNGPTRLTLSGTAMRNPTSPDQAEIPYTATALIGSRQLTLDTVTAGSAFIETSAATGGGNIPVTITVPPTGVLPAGRYRSTLTVSLAPAQ